MIGSSDDERELVLDHDLLEQLVLVGDRDPPGERPSTIKTALAGRRRLEVRDESASELGADGAVTSGRELGELVARVAVDPGLHVALSGYGHHCPVSL